MSKRKSSEKLAKFLHYVLGRHPDEFGLVPDADGWVKIKELLNALSEESGWGYVRTSHLNEIMLTLPDPQVEISDTRIRARDRSRLSGRDAAPDLPKLLYTCVRTRAHSAAMTNGIRPAGRNRVILSSQRDMAERMGRRRDRQPVTLTVQVQQAVTAGVLFEQFGENLFTAGPIPPGCFSGPPLPKEALEPRRTKKPAPLEEPAPGPGSFFLDVERAPHSRKERDKKKKGKRRREAPPWRR